MKPRKTGTTSSTWPFPDDDKEIIDLQIGLPFKYYVVIYCLLNLAICFFFEKVVVSYLIKYWSKREFMKNQKTMKKIDTEVKLNLINDVKNYVSEHKKKIKNK